MEEIKVRCDLPLKVKGPSLLLLGEFARRRRNV
jgi:hypothetical protein